MKQGLTPEQVLYGEDYGTQAYVWPDYSIPFSQRPVRLSVRDKALLADYAEYWSNVRVALDGGARQAGLSAAVSQNTM